MLTAPRAGEIFTAIQSARVVVIGDVMLDRFIGGAVKRISPEAPIPILNQDSLLNLPGGAANVARNLAHLGADVQLIGVVGDDADGAILRQTLESEPAIRPTLIADKTRPTTSKTRFTAHGQQLLRVDREDASPCPPAIAKAISDAIPPALADAEMVIISDYDKGLLGTEIIKVVQKARKNLTLLIDPKKSDTGFYGGGEIITPNLAEFHQFCRWHNLPLSAADDIDALDAGAQQILTATSIKAMMITLGANGMMLSRPNTPPLHVISMARSVYDVSGAGDTVIASLGAGLQGGAELAEAVHLANFAGGIVVEKTGTASLTPGEILALLTPHAIFTQDAARLSIQQWRARGEKIIFTNGCFDCLHPGHIWLLNEARKLGDRLVVGLNSDASTRRLKGTGRPLQHEHARTHALTALPAVDAVLLFDEDTPEVLITALTPDVLVKGGDYEADNIVGGKHVLDHGGAVQIIPLRAGYSTTHLTDG